MGKGDHRSRKGKRFRGTHGKTRPRGGKKKSSGGRPTPPSRPARRG